MWDQQKKCVAFPSSSRMAFLIDPSRSEIIIVLFVLKFASFDLSFQKKNEWSMASVYEWRKLATSTDLLSAKQGSRHVNRDR